MLTEMVAYGIVRSAVKTIVVCARVPGSVIGYDVEVGRQLLSLVERDPWHLEIHPEGQAVKVHFLEDCLYVLPK